MDSMVYGAARVPPVDKGPALVDVQPQDSRGCVLITGTRSDRLLFTSGLLCVVCIVLFNALAFTGIHWLESIPYSDYMLYSMGTWKYCHVSYSMDDEGSYICIFLQGVFAALENKEWFLSAQILSLAILAFLMINVILQYKNVTSNSILLWFKILPEHFVLYFSCGALFVATAVQLVILTAFWRDGLDMEELSLMLHYSDFLSYSILLIFVAALLAILTTVLLVKQLKTILKPKIVELAKVSDIRVQASLKSVPLP